jgi:hypothetical protein
MNNYQLFEGLIIDPINKLVSFTDENEDAVDTGLEFNPRYYKFHNWNVISIFLRKDYEILGQKFDGNPLIYALKKIKGWNFADKDEDFSFMVQRFCEICKKITPKYDTLILIPSTHTINQQLSISLIKNIGYMNLIEDFFTKPTVDEIQDSYDGVKMLNKFGQQKTEQILTRMNGYFEKMNYWFTIKNIPPNDRKYLEYYDFQNILINKDYMSLSNQKKKVNQMINDKNILIFDDTLSTGETVSRYIKNMYITFEPKSVTILTLLSAKGIN